MFHKKAFLKKSAIFTGKQLCWCLFLIKFQACLKACNVIKKRLQHKCFPVNIPKFLRTPILKNICRHLLRSIWNIGLLKYHFPVFFPLFHLFYKIGVLKNFSKIAGKYICRSLFFNKVSG